MSLTSIFTSFRVRFSALSTKLLITVMVLPQKPSSFLFTGVEPAGAAAGAACWGWACSALSCWSALFASSALSGWSAPFGSSVLSG